MLSIQRTQQHYVIRVDNQIIHRSPVFRPYRPVIKCGIRHRAIVNAVKTSNPRKGNLASPLKERSGGNGPELLEGFRKITLKILSEVHPLPFFDGIAAELNRLEPAQARIMLPGF